MNSGNKWKLLSYFFLVSVPEFELFLVNLILFLQCTVLTINHIHQQVHKTELQTIHILKIHIYFVILCCGSVAECDCKFFMFC